MQALSSISNSNNISQVRGRSSHVSHDESSDSAQNHPIEPKVDKVTLSDEATSANSEEKENNEALPKEEQQEVQELKARDTEVKAHEAAHLAAAGQHSQGGASYSYETGPDGKQYAVGGDVSISVSKESSPEATITKMQTVRRAALAPASPSGQDRKIASEAASKEAAAQKELSAQKTEETKDGADSSDKSKGSKSDSGIEQINNHDAKIKTLQAYAS